MPVHNKAYDANNIYTFSWVKDSDKKPENTIFESESSLIVLWISLSSYF